MKKLVACVLCLVLALSLAACGGRAPFVDDASATSVPDGQVEPDSIGGDPATWGPGIGTEGETVRIPNPWQECDSLEEAANIAGFPFAAPDTVEGFSQKYIAAVPNDCAQVIFHNGEDDAAEVIFRKGVGEEDISGDYNVYEDVQSQQRSGQDVTVKSNGGVIYTVLWVHDGYSYAISARTGMSTEQADEWIQALS